MGTKPARGLFITGTDTGVGKTHVGSVMVKSLHDSGYRVGVYKPVASGCARDSAGRLVSDDAIKLWEAAGRPRSIDEVCPLRFAAPLAPHLAAEAEGKSLKFEDLKRGLAAWAEGFDVVIVEGAGGLMSPITQNEFVADLAAEFGYPLVVVAPNRIGAINQALQTLVTAACFRDGLPVAGIVLNDLVDPSTDPSTSTNEREISRLAATKFLCRVGFEKTEPDRAVDWFALS